MSDFELNGHLVRPSQAHRYRRLGRLTMDGKSSRELRLEERGECFRCHGCDELFPEDELDGEQMCQECREEEGCD